MDIFYNVGVQAYGLAIRAASPFSRKAKEWVTGRKGQFGRLGKLFGPDDKVVWVHCASLGEFEQGRPVIERIRQDYPGYKILLTFFSPSGYTIRKDYDRVDAVAYLPLDTSRNARRFLDAVRPEVAIFVKYEFWLNFLDLLGRRQVPTYIISSIFRADSVFFKPHGGSFRKALKTFNTIFVQNEESQRLLAGIGINNVVVSGDTRFDRVASIPHMAKDVPIAKNFCGYSEEILVAGSTWPADEKLIVDLVKERPGLKVILVPHEPDPAHIDSLINQLDVAVVRYSQVDESTDLSSIRVLVVDTIGLLSSLYSYGRYAYIGGGFGVGIHNTLEAATFGLPVAFGPNYQKFREARELIQLGVAAPVETSEQLTAWYDKLKDNPRVYAEAKAKALSYIAANKGATDTIIEKIFG